VLGPPLDVTNEVFPGNEATVASPAPGNDSGPNPFEDAVWRREGGSDADAEVASAHPIVDANPLRESIVAAVKNKRNLAIAAGGVVVLIVLIVMMMGGSKKASDKRANAKHPVKTQALAKPTPVETPEQAAPVETPSEPAAETQSAGSAEAPAETPTETPAETPPSEHHTATSESGTTEPKKKTTPTLGGKQVVLEYDTQAREGKPVPNAAKDDQSAISKARTSYAAGNTRLFAGDADGAIKNYKQALGYYPGYVAAYRGLGLAYAQKGENAAAAKALRTYVGAAPGAKDAAIIRKRIQTLK